MNGRSASKDTSLILVVDDDPVMRLTLRRVMEKEGYRVCEARDGQECLQIYQQHRPDLVLMDGMMPQLNGFEACALLQKLPGGERTPVLIITGLDDNDSVDEAFAVGATDYVTKPIHWAVLRQRVRRILKLKQAEELRDDLTHMIVHDMKNPITAINGFSEMLLTGLDSSLTEAQREAVLRIHRNSDALLNMTLMILDIKRMREGKLPLNYSEEPVCLALRQVTDNLGWMARNYGVELQVDCPDQNLSARLDWTLLQRVLTNLLTNAIKHSGRGAQVRVRADLQAAELSGQEPLLTIAVLDQGEGIAEQDQALIFDKFSQARERQGGSRADTGLGLTFCKLAVEAQNGYIRLDSQTGVGSTFTLLLPLKPSA